MRASLTPLVLLSLLACGDAPHDDACDVAFVHQVVPTLLGRRVRGHAELSALVTLVEEEGRQGVVEALMEEEDFVDYWTELLTDRLQVVRATSTARPEACYDTTTLSDPEAVALADFIADNPPDTTPTWNDDHHPATPDVALTDYTIADVMRGAILADRLDVVYRMDLFQIAVYDVRHNLSSNPLYAAEPAAYRFFDVHLNRQPDCFACHVSTFSVAEDLLGSGHDRHHPTDLDFEGSWFSTVEDLDSSGSADASDPVDIRYGGQPGDTEIDRVYSLFTPANVDATGAVVATPWAVSADCVTDGSVEGFLDLGSAAGVGSHDAGFAGMTPGTGNTLVELAAALQTGRTAASGGWPTTFMHPTEVGDASAADPTPTCDGCHGSDPPAHDDLLPTRSDGRILQAMMHGYGGAMEDLDFEYLDALNQLAFERAEHGAYVGDRVGVVAGDQAYALGVAAAIVDNVTEDVYGARLTLEHGFPRTADQKEVLQELTTHFVSRHDWALKGLLTELVLSPMFNRQAPAAHDPADIDAVWALGMIANPWVSSHDGYSGDQADANGQGDLVHRWPVPNVFRSQADALGWPGPRVFNTTVGYPSDDDLAWVGRFVSDNQPGFSGVTLQSLWAWEWAPYQGTMNLNEGHRPAYVEIEAAPYSVLNNDEDDDGANGADDPDELANLTAAGSGVACINGLGTHFVGSKEYVHPTDGDLPCWMDWIDMLLVEADANDTVTLAELLDIVEDRVLGSDAVIEPDSGTFDTDFGLYFASSGADMTDPWSDYAADDDARRGLRRYATTLTTSPQFLLAGIPTVTAVGDAPTLAVCMPGEVCTEEDWVDHYRTTLIALGYSPVASADLVVTLEPSPVPFGVSGPAFKKLEFTVEVVNEGAETAQATWLWAGTDQGNEWQFFTPELPPGAGWAMNIGFPVPASGGIPTGTTWLMAFTDHTDVVPESDSSNNGVLVEISTATWLPDLRVEGARLRPAGPGSWELHFDVVNRGWVASAATSVEVLDDATGPAVYGVGALVPSAAQHIVLPFSSACQSVLITADIFDGEIEIDETNNEQLLTMLPWTSGACSSTTPPPAAGALMITGAPPPGPPPPWAPTSLLSVSPYATSPAVTPFASWLDTEIDDSLDNATMTGLAHVDGRTEMLYEPQHVQVRSAEGREWTADSEPPW